MEVSQLPDPGTRSLETITNAYSKQYLLFVLPRIFALNNILSSLVFLSIYA